MGPRRLLSLSLIHKFEATDPETHGDVVEKAFADGDIDVTLVAFGVQLDNEKCWTDPAAARLTAEVNYVAPMSLGVHLSNKLRKQGHGHLVICLLYTSDAADE